MASSNVPSFMLSSFIVTSTFLPIFFTYWRSILSGSPIPGLDTSKEKSPSGKKPISSTCLYNLLFILIHFSIPKPLSASKNILILLVDFTFISTKKISSYNRVNNILFTVSIFVSVAILVCKRRREPLVPFLSASLSGANIQTISLSAK